MFKTEVFHLLKTLNTIVATSNTPSHNYTMKSVKIGIV